MADRGLEGKRKPMTGQHDILPSDTARSKGGRQDKNAVQTFCLTFLATPSARR